MHHNLYRLAVGGICFHHGRILLLLRKPDAEIFPSVWELPSGGVEENESLELALKREVKEETGLIVEVGEFMGYFLYESKWEIPCIQINHFCTLQESRSEEIMVSDEHEKGHWVGLRRLRDYNTTEQVQKILRSSCNYIKEKGLFVSSE